MDITVPPRYSHSKFPLFPPTTDPDRCHEIVSASGLTDDEGRYWHWDKLRLRNPPHDWSVEEWWAGMKWVRNQQGRNLPFVGKNGSPFMFVMPACIQSQLHWLGRNLKGNVQAQMFIAKKHEGEKFTMMSLMREALASSSLDGAAVSWERGMELANEGNVPQTPEEWIVVNHYRALEYSRKNTEDDLSPGMLLHIYRIMTTMPFSEPSVASRFRDGTEKDSGKKSFDTAWHVPPHGGEIEERIFRLCSFANNDMGDSLDPIVRAILLHLMLLYDLPFAEANGRMARLLFFWSMTKWGGSAAEWLSISSILAGMPRQYERSFRYVVTDENDATYFVIHQLDVMIRALQSLRTSLDDESQQESQVKGR